jgi:hypothetical protein
LRSESSPAYALSLKQPWAALVVLGLKTIEVRSWPTARRGRILIHAARVPDNRDEAWKHVTPAMLELAELQGGIIGSVELTDCLRYAELPTFLTDQPAHLNEPSWYVPPLMFGFKFTSAKVLPFQRYPGWFRFFTIKPDLMESRKAEPKQK